MIEFLKMFGVFLGISTTMIAPMMWFVKRQGDKNDVLSKEMIIQFKDTATTNHKDLKNELTNVKKNINEDILNSNKEFHKSIEKLNFLIDAKDKDMKTYINANINDIKAFIADIELKIDETNKANHELEKDFLRFKTEVSKYYVSHNYLDKVIVNNK